jgi:hypothetical protein
VKEKGGEKRGFGEMDIKDKEMNISEGRGGGCRQIG